MTTKLDELDALIISNLADLDAAANRLNHAILTRLFDKAFPLIAAQCQKVGWVGENLWDEEVWFAPRKWAPSKTRRRAYFSWEFGTGDTAFNRENEAQFDLSRLCQVGSAWSGFRFVCPALSSNKKKRTAVINPFIEEAKQFGFYYETGGFLIHRWGLKTNDLADAFRSNNFAKALKPLSTALRSVFASAKVFDQIAARAQRA